MPLAVWQPPIRIEPSASHKGEATFEVIHASVGGALSQWEFVETVCLKLFQLFCETPSLAACRAYGTIISGAGRIQALEAASVEFFRRRGEPYPEDLTALLRAAQKGGGFRNKIAHGVATGCRDEAGASYGYYHMPASYAARHREISLPTERWWLAADYFYVCADIQNCKDRFEALVSEGMRLILELNTQYRVLQDSQFHP